MREFFDKKADRSGSIKWLKDYFTPECILEHGMVGYAGAEFEFATCPAYCRGVEEAAKKGVFGFTMLHDTYRNAVKWWMKELREYEIQEEWIVPTHGTIFSLATAIRMVTEPGENIIVMSPNYNRYNQAARRLKRGVVTIPLLSERCGESAGTEIQTVLYRIDWEALEAAFEEEKNKIFVLCNPNNPTGHIYSFEDLKKIAALSKKYGVLVFSDEIFAEITFEGHAVIPYTKAAGPDALAITCTSMGKVFSLTGVNHANVLIENDTLRERYMEQRNADHFGSIDPMVYAGLVEAYTPEGRAWVFELRKYLWENFRLFAETMKACLTGAIVTKPQGTFVVWVDYSAYEEQWETLRSVLEIKGMLVGDDGEDYYGKSTCVRYSIAVPRAELQKTLHCVREALKNDFNWERTEKIGKMQESERTESLEK